MINAVIMILTRTYQTSYSPSTISIISPSMSRNLFIRPSLESGWGFSSPHSIFTLYPLTVCVDKDSLSNCITYSKNKYLLLLFISRDIPCSCCCCQWLYGSKLCCCCGGGLGCCYGGYCCFCCKIVVWLLLLRIYCMLLWFGLL